MDMLSLFVDSQGSWGRDTRHEHEQGGGAVESIMVSMWDCDAPSKSAKALNQRDAARARNRVCAREGREADRVYTELLLAELHSIAETFEVCATYIAQLQVHGACAAECAHGLALCLANTASISLVQKSEMGSSMQALLGVSIKERNRLHAQKSRWKKRRFVRDIVQQRDASLSVVADLMQNTLTLEGSCGVLNDLSRPAAAFLLLADLRHRLLQRCSTHAQQCDFLKSPLVYRAMHRVNFRQCTH